jgi:OFA family oxalate/formate antiporter-like MFS transporter
VGSLSTADASASAKSTTGWIVTFAGTGINLALGVLYSWSVISKAIEKEWGWSGFETSLPYSVALIVFAFATIPAGRMQDKIGPRWVAAAGGVLVGLGFLVCGLTNSLWTYMIGFGIIAGAGIGFGYASATPPAVKWFHKARTGLIAGIVVSGFGLASVYTAPTAEWLKGAFGIQTAMLIFGIAFFFVVFGLAQLLKPPPADYVPPVPAGSNPPLATETAAPEVLEQREFGPGEMLRTPQFYLLWFMYACGAGAGLMVVSKMAKIADVQAGLSLGFILVAILAIGNGGGRILAGFLSDKIGRTRTLLIIFLLQAILLLILSQTTKDSFLSNTIIMAICSALIGANYGANLAVFPAISKYWFGLKNFGVNYGFLFTAWGIGGFVLSQVAGAVYDANQTSPQPFNQAYFLAAALLVISGLVTFLVRAPKAAVAPRGFGQGQATGTVGPNR